MDIESFIAEIIANPDDDAARLIFADYLEEQGDPRAEMIRLQFEMADLSRWDPKRPKLRKRELALLKEYGGFGKTPIGVRPLGSRGGFLDAVEVTVARFLRLHEQIFAQAPIREILLRSKSTRFGKLATCESMNRVRRLTLKGTQATDIQLVELLQSPSVAKLRGLEIRQTGHGHRLAEGIATSPNLAGLRELRLNGLPSSMVQLLADSSTIQGLEHLSVGLWADSDTDVSSLAGSENFWNLTSVAFAGSVTAPSLLQFLNSPNMSRLTTVTLVEHSERRRRLGAVFEQATPHESVQQATLALNCDDQCVPGLLRVFPKVRVLELAHNRIGEAGALALAESPRLNQLDRLVLTGNRIPLSGIQALAESSHRRRSMKLLLRGNRLSRKDVEKLQSEYGKSFGNLGKPRDYSRSGWGLW